MAGVYGAGAILTCSIVELATSCPSLQVMILDNRPYVGTSAVLHKALAPTKRAAAN